MVGHQGEELGKKLGLKEHGTVIRGWATGPPDTIIGIDGLMGMLMQPSDTSLAPGDTAIADTLGGAYSLPGGYTMTAASGGGGGTCIRSGITQTYYIVAMGKVWAEYGNVLYGAMPKFKYIYAGDQRIAMRNGQNQLHYYLNDHLGSARVVVDSTNAVKDRYLYTSFGSPATNTTVSTGQPDRYTGKPYDEDNNLNLFYYGARYYDGTMGRFTQIDQSRANSPGWGPYVYVEDNPLMKTDPDGKNAMAISAGFASISWIPVVGQVAGAIAIGVAIGYGAHELVNYYKGGTQKPTVPVKPLSGRDPVPNSQANPGPGNRAPNNQPRPVPPNRPGPPQPAESKEPFPNGPLTEPTGGPSQNGDQPPVPTNPNMTPQPPSIGPAAGVVTPPPQNNTNSNNPPPPPPKPKKP